MQGSSKVYAIRDQSSARGWDHGITALGSGITALGSGSAPFFIESGIRLQTAECDND